VVQPGGQLLNADFNVFLADTQRWFVLPSASIDLTIDASLLKPFIVAAGHLKTFIFFWSISSGLYFRSGAKISD